MRRRREPRPGAGIVDPTSTLPPAVGTQTPPASLTPAIYGPVTVVTGVATCPSPDLGTETTDTNGDKHYRGGTFTCTVQTDDARASGTETESWNADGWGSGPSDGALVQWGTARLENATGAWEGTFSGVYSSDRGDIVVSWYKGTGGYASLSYFEQTIGGGPWQVQGQIFPGTPPTP